MDCPFPRKPLAAPAMAPLPPFAAVIVAAGQGLRAGGPVPKQFASWSGKPLVRHSAEALASFGAHPIIVAIPEGAETIAREALAGVEDIRLVVGGATRQLSVHAALEALTLDELKAIDARIDERVYSALSVEASVAARASHGGTAPAEVERQVAAARAALGMD